MINKLNVNQEQLENMVREEVKKKLKEVIEKLLLEERNIFLEEHPENKGNGFYERNLLTTFGEIKGLKIPRDRLGEFHPGLIPYRKKISYELSEIITAMVITGSSTRDISFFIQKVYNTMYSAQSICRLTRIAEEEIESWKSRKLKERYAIIYFDAMFIHLRRDTVEKEPVYIVLGITEEGYREILGFYTFGSEGESIESWKMVLENLRQRGLKKVDLFVSDDVNDRIIEVVKEIFPKSKHQLCIVHLMRRTSNFVRKKDKEDVLKDCKRIYQVETREEAYEKLHEFKLKWGILYPKVIRIWERKLDYYLTFLEFPKEIRKYIYSTNLLEREIKEIRRRVKVIEVFSHEKSLSKYLYFVCLERNHKMKHRKLNNFDKFFRMGVKTQLT